MASEQPRVVIFDDFEKGGRFIYRDVAVEAAAEAGWQAWTFDNAGFADRYLFENGDDIQAVISTLGRQAAGSFGYQFPAMPLLHQACAQRKPIALLSDNSQAGRHIRTNSSDVVVPKTPFEQIAPVLYNWLDQLVAKPV